MSLATFIANLESDIETTETDVLTWFAQIKAGAQVLEADIALGLKWLAGVAPGIATDLQETVSLLTSIPGLSIPATVLTAVDASAAALNSVAASEASGATTGQTLVNGVVAVQQALAAKSAAVLAVAAK